jgi:tetratricopeptide (TPR) repeat protein
MSSAAPPVQKTPTPSRTRRGPFTPVLLAALVALVVAVYWPALWGELVYDDEVLLGPANPATQSIGAAVRHAFEPLWSFDRASQPEAGGAMQRAFWRPLTVVALAVGRTLTPESTLGPHVVSLLLHLVATLAAFGLARRLLDAAGVRGADFGGFAVAALFALHPVQVEAVAWIAAVNDPLFGALSLLALWLHARWDGNGSPWLRGPALGALVFLAALLAKEQALVVPALVVGVDLVLRQRVRLQALAPYGVALGVWFVTRVVVFRDVFGGFVEAQGDFGFSAAREAGFRVELLGGFLRLLAWPLDLTVFRPVRPELPAGDPAVLHGALWLAGFCAALGASLWRRARAATFGLVVVAVMPTLVAAALHTAGRYPLSDRYLYLPVFGFALALVSALFRVLPRDGALVAAGGLTIAAAFGVRDHVPAFATNDAFFDAALAGAPKDPYLHAMAGRVDLIAYQETMDVKRLHDAHRHFLLSLTAGTLHGKYQFDDDPSLPMKTRLQRLEQMLLAPKAERTPDPTVLVTPFERLEANLGQIYVHLFAAQTAEVPDTFAALRIAEELVGFAAFSHDSRVWTAKGQVHKVRGELDEAVKCFREALTRDPRDAIARKRLGEIYALRGEHTDARKAYEEALKVLPEDLDLRIGALDASLREGQLALAEHHLQRLVAAAPGAPESAYWTGCFAAERGNPEAALEAFDRALALRPGWGLAAKGRGLVLSRLGDSAGALESLSDAARTLPTDFDVHHALAKLLAHVFPPETETPAQRAQRVDVLMRAYRLSTTLAERRSLEADLRPLIQHDPDRMFDLATALEKQGDLAAARYWLPLVIRAADAWPEAQREDNLAEAWTRYGVCVRVVPEALPDAIEAFEAALALRPNRFMTLFELAATLHTAKRTVEAGAVAARALQQFDPERLAPELRAAVRDRLESWVREGEAANIGPPLPPAGG